MKSRTPLVAGNWKMNGREALLSEMAEALGSYEGVAQVLICPPFPYLAAARSQLPAAIKVGGQWRWPTISVVQAWLQARTDAYRGHPVGHHNHGR